MPPSASTGGQGPITALGVTYGKRAVSSAAVAARIRPRQDSGSEPGTKGPYAENRSIVRAPGPGVLSQLRSGSKLRASLSVTVVPGLTWLTHTRQACLTSEEFSISWPVARGQLVVGLR